MQSNPPITVTFSPNVFETYSALRAISAATPYARRIRQAAKICAIVCVGLFVAAVLIPDAEHVLTILAAFALLVPIIVIPMPWFISMLNTAVVRFRNPNWGETTYVIGDDGIHLRYPRGDGFIAWSAITRRAETRKFFLFFSSDLFGRYIPKRAITNAEDERSIARLLQVQHSATSIAKKESEEGGFEREQAIVTVTYSPNAKELSQASLAAFRLGRLFWPTCLLSLGLVFGLNGLPAYWHWQTNGWGPATIIDVVFGLVLLMMFSAFPVIVNRLTVRRHLRTNRIGTAPVTIKLLTNGLVINQLSGDSSLPWSAFTSARETGKFFLLFMNEGAAVLIPKRVLMPGEIQRTRELLREQLHDRAKGIAGNSPTLV